ncbi:MAG: hypothetical protein NZ700_03760 [Gemmataceae bacterium]|nr:hypothetical protein [Gemmataceae bacterium]MDW8266261.1 ketopantoate reductase C-terminal domain-containing protein [Gemmataceae bacterium]
MGGAGSHTPPVYVVGAGGIGCAVGYALLQAGRRVVFVETDPAKVDWGRTHGVAVDHWPARRADFEHFHNWSPPPGATVLLCTKCYDNPAVLGRLPPRTVLVPIQNGFDAALERYSDSPEGIASFVSECLPGRPHTRITRRGELHVGFRGGGPDSAVFDFVASWRHTPLFRLRVVPDILPFKYTKLMYNAAISPLAAAAGLDNGQLLAVPLARRLFFALLQENYDILRAASVPLGKIGPFHPHTVARILRRPAVAHALAWAFYPTLRRTYCSMSGDLPSGRTEIDFYNRHLLDLADGRPCPLNRGVYNLVKRMERERQPPTRDVLDELAAIL